MEPSWFPVMGGVTWTDRSIQTQEWLYSIEFVDEVNWLVGGDHGLLLRTRDAGLSWYLVEGGISDVVYSIQIDQNGSGFLGGGDIYVTKDFGETWRLSLEVPRLILKDVEFFDADNGVSVGQGGSVLETRDGGENWLPSSVNSDFSLFAVGFSTNGSACAVGDNGTILRKPALSGAWSVVPSQTTSSLMAIDFSGQGPGVIVGLGGVVLKSEDAGASWNAMESGFGFDLYGVACIDEQTYLVAGYSPTLIKTTDGGTSWRQIPISIDSPVQSIKFCNETDGFLSTSGGAIWKTKDAGESWQLCQLLAGPVLDLDCTTDGMIVGVSYFGNLVWSLDGGEVWGYSALDWRNHLFGVSVVERDALVVVGTHLSVFKRSDWRESISNQLEGETTKWLGEGIGSKWSNDRPSARQQTSCLID